MSGFLLISLGIVLASVFGFVARVFRLPLLLGYVAAGFLLASLGLFEGNRQLLENMAALGVTFLLFLVGLEMNMTDIRSIGRVALATGVGQILITLSLGGALALIFGFTPLTALYIGIALAFSSTIIAVKLLSEKRDIYSLYGRIAIGFLLVQDLVAILVLVFLAGLAGGQLTGVDLAIVFGKGAVFLAIIIFLEKSILPKVFNKIAISSAELLFVASIAWALLVAAVVSLPQVGFSIEIGGFLAGLALAGTSERLQIGSRIRPLRDFFITLFFLVLGAKMVTGISPDIILPAIAFSALVLIGNPLIVLSIMGLLGHKARTAFLASVTVAQISEFSFIVIIMAEKIGHVGPEIVGLITIVGVITMTVSSYVISNSEALYHKFAPVLDFFERTRTKEGALATTEKLKNHTVLIGADRTGWPLLPTLKGAGELLVVDFNPKVVTRLSADGIQAIYGDIADAELLEILNLGQARLVISTCRSMDDNLYLLEHVKTLSEKPITVFFVGYPHEALTLYEAGADYVIVPRIVGSEHLAHILKNHKADRAYFQKLRNHDFEHLAKDRFLG